MRSSFAILALAAGALARPQAVTSEIAPTATAPAGCSSSHAGTFEITVVNATTSKKRSLAERSALVLSLSGGVLTDAAGRTGYIASNYQFQFDDPPQAGAIYTAGFSVCGNDSLALGGSTVFYQCNSGDFYNLYDRSWAAQCSPVYLVALGGTAATVTQASDGQPAATTGLAVTQITDGQPQVVTQISDGQIQQPTGIPVSQISDGQPQGPTGVAVSQISDGQIQATSAAAVVSQISDGQIQATSAAAVVSQISDGQIQATSAAPVVSQISDGQIQATSAAAVVTQISDGQIQATTAAVVVSQISDGQIQATSAASVVSEATDGQIIATSAPSTLATTAVVSQISDGQIQAVATNGTTVATATATLAQFTGAAATPVLGLGAMAAGVFGVIAML